MADSKELMVCKFANWARIILRKNFKNLLFGYMTLFCTKKNE